MKRAHRMQRFASAFALLFGGCTLEFDPRLLDGLGPRCTPGELAPLGLEEIPLGVTAPMGAGVILEDLDGDSDLDLFSANEGIDPMEARLFETQRIGCDPPTVLDATARLLGPRDATDLAAFIAVPLVDEHVDLLAPGWSTGRALRGQAGMPLFSTTETFFVPGSDGHLVGRGIAVGDLNGDGFLDVLLGGGTAPLSVGSLILSDANGRLRSMGPSPALSGVGRAWIADFDMDGAQEVLLVPDDEPARMVRLEGTELVDDEGITNPEILTLATEVAVGDLDNDGDLDLFTLRDGGATPLHPTVIENAEGTWVLHDGSDLSGAGNDGSWNYGNAGAYIAIGVADFDLDGRLDVVSVLDTVQVLRNATTRSSGSVVFGLERIDAADLGLPLVFGTHFALGDLEGDGDVDLAVSSTEASVHLVRNTVAGRPWLRVRLRGAAGNARGVGAVVCAFEEGLLPPRGCSGPGLVGMRILLATSAQTQALEASMATPGVERVDLRVIWPSGLGVTDTLAVRVSRGIVVGLP